ncbi:MAG: 23S rRNA (guanosine(2251)-2'-O)-methyltransferase RlmB [Bacteroidota bacterium]
MRHEFEWKERAVETQRANVREGPSSELIAGRNPVMEALRAGAAIEKVVFLYGAKGSAIERIKALARQSGVPCVEVNKQRFRELVSDATTQGVVAIVETKAYLSVDQILQHARERNEPPFVLVLDELDDPHNIGALIRTAESAAVHGVVVPKHHAAPITHTVSKTSAGAIEHMRVAKVTNITQTLDELKSEGLWVVGADPEGDRLFYDLDYTMPVAVVIGNEGRGIRRLVKEKCDFLVRIPMLGKVQSLNASVAGALILYEAVRKRSHQD